MCDVSLWGGTAGHIWELQLGRSSCTAIPGWPAPELWATEDAAGRIVANVQLTRNSTGSSGEWAAAPPSPDLAGGRGGKAGGEGQGGGGLLE
jgi:hypothetical protein